MVKGNHQTNHSIVILPQFLYLLHWKIETLADRIGDNPFSKNQQYRKLKLTSKNPPVLHKNLRLTVSIA